jgi:glycerol uptake facilitator-like aquaporin
LVINKYLAEFMGTFILVFVGSMGILSMNGAAGAAEIVGIALAFGLGLFAAIWCVAHVSGAHFNPAVASLVILAASSQEAVAMTMTTFTDRNTAILVETAMTAIFVWVILASTKTAGRNAASAIALTLVAIHVAAIPFSGSSVNPARSFGPAAVSTEWTNLWVYIVAPLVGAVIGALLYRLFSADEAPSET